MNEINVKIEKKGNKLKSIVFGLVVIAAGVLLIYRNMGLLDPEMKRIFFSWQMIMIAAGFINVFGKSSRLFGLILMSVGGFFMLPRIMELPVNFTQTFWPLLVIVAGVLIVFFSMKGCKRFGKVSQSSTDDVIDDMFVFSGGERSVTTEDFKGGKSVNVFGGSTYDMTRSNLAEGTHILEVFCVFGGTKIIVPSNWNVRIEVSSVLGAFEDKRKFLSETVNPKGTLIIKGVAVLGGGEIASHK
jgi:predicted membrane protein